MDFVSLLADDDDEPVLRRKFCKANALCRDCRSSQIPNEIMFNSNILLSRLHSLTLETLGAERIAEEARNVNLVLTDEEVNEIENLTRKQAKCELWGWVRIGRITASIFLECIHARTDSVPAKMSLLKKICHPDFSEINSAAVRYGKANETKASLVVQKLLEGHQNVRFDECGIFVDKTRPYLAATPDLIMRCDCCGTVCIEIKCPFRLAKKSQLNKDLKIIDLDFIDGNDGTLKEQHKYFWQVMAQIHITGSNYGLFFVWSEGEHTLIKIDKDDRRWSEACDKANLYFTNIILPIASGKFLLEPLAFLITPFLFS
ncbi:uncharacterized protein LOC120428185 [Culex pipiens pallens]|uniref:uncharacterized protein LOC120428185 n=1 Tax=Culex pipiens pallens TaxID=42434 RepID=UPI0019534825|nr:uncharacterized protein LOC120428185 [Culex pipiens pallens]